MTNLRRLVRVAAIPIFLALTLTIPAQAANASGRAQRFQNEMLRLVNQTRGAHGLHTVSLNRHLSREAWRHSVAMEGAHVHRSATSKRCSSLQATISAASGVRSGQFRQAPLLAWSNVSLPRGPSEIVLRQRRWRPAAWQGRDEPGDEQSTERGQQQRAARRRSVQTLPPRHPLSVLAVVRVSGQWLALGCLQHPLHCDRRVRHCDK